MKKLFRRLWKKVKISLHRWFRDRMFNDYIEDTPIQTTAINICRRVMHLPESELLYAPMSQKRYIRNEELGIFIIIKDKQIDVVNHIYHYNVELPFNRINKIVRMFDTETELRRSTYEKQMMSQIGHSLSKILDSIK
jgi:hypothetical protein